MSLKWKKISEVSLKAGYRKYIRKHFRMPSGIECDFDVKDEGRVVCILPLTADQKVVIARQFRPGPEKVVQCLPGGLVDSGETPLRAAARELLEETGYVGKLQLVAQSMGGAYSNMLRYNFVALDCKKIAKVKDDPREPIEVELISLDQLKKILRRGNTTDLVTGFMGLDYLGLL